MIPKLHYSTGLGGDRKYRDTAWIYKGTLTATTEQAGQR